MYNENKDMKIEEIVGKKEEKDNKIKDIDLDLDLKLDVDKDIEIIKDIDNNDNEYIYIDEDKEENYTKTLEENKEEKSEIDEDIDNINDEINKDIEKINNRIDDEIEDIKDNIKKTEDEIEDIKDEIKELEEKIEKVELELKDVDLELKDVDLEDKNSSLLYIEEDDSEKTKELKRKNKKDLLKKKERLEDYKEEIIKKKNKKENKLDKQIEQKEVQKRKIERKKKQEEKEILDIIKRYKKEERRKQKELEEKEKEKKRIEKEKIKNTPDSYFIENYLDRLESEDKLYEVIKIKKSEKRNLSIVFDEIVDIKTFSDIVKSCDVKYNRVDDSIIFKDSVENFVNIFKLDSNINKHIRFNEMTNFLEYTDIDEDGNIKVENWKNSYTSALMLYVEANYNGLYNEKKFYNALETYKAMVGYNPLKDLIELEEWDKVPRIDKFLDKIFRCDNDKEYLKEVSRMIFYGGINRLYNRGCKFDYMPVLYGRQGTGKSTIIRWLALNDTYFRDISTIKDKAGMEILVGSWICEVSELMAFKSYTDVEEIKSFLSREVDKFRPAYAKDVETYPRTCIFIGTTNNETYLSDLTGNRRFLPLNCCMEVGELYEHEQYIKEYILKCWREALYMLKENKTYLIMPSELSEYIDTLHKEAMQEDIRQSIIDDYLDSLPKEYKVCSLELLEKGLGLMRKEIKKSDTILIGKYMSNRKDFVKKDHIYITGYGYQRAWIKTYPNREIAEKSINNVDDNYDKLIDFENGDTFDMLDDFKEENKKDMLQF